MNIVHYEAKFWNKDCWNGVLGSWSVPIVFGNAVTHWGTRNSVAIKNTVAVVYPFPGLSCYNTK